jgi:ATP-dependent DNA helicase RecQ
VLLSGTEETEIADYFIDSAFPTRNEVQQILDTLLGAQNGLSVPELLYRLNITKDRIEKTLALLSLESPSPIAKQDTKWQLTSSTLSEEFWQRAERLTNLRHAEQQQMQQYVNLSTGHMEFLIEPLMAILLIFIHLIYQIFPQLQTRLLYEQRKYFYIVLA